MRSSRMRLPAFGARGSMSAAGVSRRVAATAAQVATNVTPTPSPVAAKARGQLTGMAPRGTKYTIEYASMMTHGSTCESTAMPTTLPRREAAAA